MGIDSRLSPGCKGLTQLFLDGEAAVRVDTETFLRSGLKPGDLLTDEELHSLLQASDAAGPGRRRSICWSTAAIPNGS